MAADLDITAPTLPATTSAWSTDAPAAPHLTLARGALLGRYVIIEMLGAGAMGVVYSAFDPELDRKVAVKLVKPGEDDPDARARLLREARAMARLAHPNVVAVHDVGTFGDEVFVAMEFVQGVTLGRWLRERPRSWREVVELFVAAGHGLAAAHEAGLVHRDLKPENIMVGPGTRVRVMDFGLARSAGSVREGSSASPDGAAALPSLTRVGAVPGTPAYMAPEQWDRRPADARSDQFSLCVALWEAVHGERPFHGDTLPSLMLAITSGERSPPRDPARAPPWLRELLVRGLAVDPAARWPSVAALCDALERRPDPTSHARERLIVAALLVGAMFAWMLYYDWTDDGTAPSVGANLLPPAILAFGLLGLVSFYFRKSILRNPAHRGRLLMFITTGGFVFASRLAGARGGEAIESVVLRDVMICGVGICALASFVTPHTRLLPVAAMVPPLGVAAIILYPASLAIAATLSLDLPILLALADWHLSARAAKPPGPAKHGA